MPTIFIKDNLRASVEAATGGKITVLYDSKGYPSYMRIIPKFKIEDIDPALGSGVHPAFVVGGVEKSEIFIGVYQAKIFDGNACSLPGMDPTTNINYDTAKNACKAKGAGWHLMSMHEWSAVALWCLKNGFQPRGNTNWGRAYDATYETGTRVDNGTPGSTSGTGRTLTGSGPASWRHDNTFEGISDIVGNVWEWMDLFKLVDGRVYCTEDNNFNMDESDWPAQDVYFDASAASSSTSTANNVGTNTLSDSITNYTGPTGNNGGYDYAYNATWNTMSVKATWDPPALMKQLLIAPSSSDGTSQTQIDLYASVKGAIWVRNYGERIPVRGGSWSNAASAGLAALNLTSARSNVLWLIGFRPAYIG